MVPNYWLAAYDLCSHDVHLNRRGAWEDFSPRVVTAGNRLKDAELRRKSRTRVMNILKLQQCSNFVPATSCVVNL